tara:strand:- start:868 stop:1242 length:375 start_codon:yes stop_codon:yes gene_type:complete
MEIDKNIILKLISVLEDLKKSLNDKNYKIEDFKMDSQSSPAKVEEDSAKSIKSPIVGTAYLAPEPGAKKFVEQGKKIKKGETIMIVEAMKTMNHVPSSMDGIVKKICVEDGQPVEFGQNLIVLE